MYQRWHHPLICGLMFWQQSLANGAAISHLWKPQLHITSFLWWKEITVCSTRWHSDYLLGTCSSCKCCLKSQRKQFFSNDVYFLNLCYIIHSHVHFMSCVFLVLTCVFVLHQPVIAGFGICRKDTLEDRKLHSGSFY